MKKLSFLDSGIAQIAYVVEDLDKVVENYYKKFGIGPWHFYTYEKPLVKNMTRNGKPASYRMRIALSYFGPTRIELIQHLDGDTVYSDFIKKHGYGVQHLGVLVDDMTSAIAEAEEAGLRVSMDGSGFGPDGDGHYAYLDTDDEFGTTIELIQRPKGRKKPEKIYPPDQAGPMI
ncbi:MAG: VOC family protein [Spirochaetales bacterium]|uniref:VOC family protein n=1 Tax=Candidatus Thalassospirochaeta sargassi TaxID=3119039 RepID=A0AAJ1IEE1_9SPIO|nr:VOC family protein [Spirochaetales bacterium]